MPAVNLVLASLITAVVVALPAVIPVPKKPQAETWIAVGRTADAAFEVLAQSMEPDLEMFSMQFILRTTLNSAQKNTEGQEIKVYVESTVVACKQDILITLNQLQYTPAGEHVNTVNTARLYENSLTKGAVITELIEYVCGAPAKKSQKSHMQSIKFT